MITPRTDQLIDLAIEEDAGLGDLTSRAIFPSNHRSRAFISAGHDLVICGLEVAALADFVGSTSGMMKYVKTTNAPYYLMLTECGLVSRLQVETPEKSFIGGCRLCPYMKMNTLEKVRDALLSPRPDQIITLDEDLRRRAARCIERMFELAPAN